MSHLSGKRALVTGGASGIGAATARLLASHGAEVIVADRDTAAGEAVASEVGGRFVALDVTKPDGWTSVPEVDFAHLNAGTMTKIDPCTLDDLTPANWRRLCDVNIEGVMNGLFAVVPGMRSRGGGSIVVMGSLAAFVGFGDDPFYGATKAFLVNLARAMAAPLSEANVRINAICPGEVATGMLPTNRAELLASKGYRPLEPSEVAEAVVETMTGGGTGEVFTLVRGRGRELREFEGVPRPLRT